MHSAIAHRPELPSCDPSSPLVSSPSLYTKHDIIWYKISPWLVWVTYPGCVPSQLLVKINSVLAEPRTDCKERTLSQCPTFLYFFLEDPMVYFLSSPNTCIMFSRASLSKEGMAFINKIRMAWEIVILFCYCSSWDPGLLTLCNLI